MRTALALIVALPLLAAPATAGADAALRVQFRPPGDFQGSLAVQGAAWAILFFEGEAAFDLESGGPLEVTRHSYPIVHGDVNRTLVLPNLGAEAVDEAEPAARAVRVAFGAWGPGSLAVSAESIAVTSAPAPGQVVAADGLTGLRGQLPADLSDRNPFWVEHGGPTSPQAAFTIIPDAPSAATIEVRGLRSVTWFGARASCPAAECPSGGGLHYREASAYPLRLAAGSFDYVEATDAARGASLRGGGAFRVLAVGGPSFDARVDGALRLPSAGAAGCPSCLDPDGGTLVAEGNLTLAGLRLRPEGGRVEAALGGTIAAARLDEAAVDPASLLGAPALAAGAAAAVGLGLLLKLLAGPLFTRHRDPDVLDLPNRRALHEAVLAHPGAGFRELTRITGLAVGTARHHLTVLARHGKVVERPHGKSLAFFPGGDGPGAWVHVVVLRDENLRLLHGWVEARPGCTQKQVLAAMGALGWTRGTVQNRLERLQGSGLLASHRVGRQKHYAAAAVPAHAATASAAPPAS